MKKLLKKYKEKSKYSNKYISQALSYPQTLVEHWFRSDNSFSIPNENIWLQLKKLLNIETNDFDKSIMTFETKVGVYEKSSRIYDSNGIAPCLTAMNCETEKFIIWE